MSARAVWLRVTLGVSAAALSVLTLPVPPPAGVRVGLLHAAGLGLAAGAALFLVLARRPPARRRPRAAQAFVVVCWSWVEEALWRRLVLGGAALAVGAPAAVAAATALFALAHRDRAAHALTGAVFGGLYVATGRLTGAAAAHAAYNLLVATARPAREVPP